MAINEGIDFEALFRESYNSLCYFSNQYISDPAAAEDLVQDAFLQLYKMKGSMVDNKSAKSYLYTCVRNAALNIIRHQKVEQKFINHHSNIESEDRVMDDIITAEVVGALNRAIEALPDKCKEIFKLGYFDELKNQEIADQLSISVNTVKTQKQRALQMLRVKLRNIDMASVLIMALFRVSEFFF